MIVLAIFSLAIALYCYAISQLAQHGQLRWSKEKFSFWGEDSDHRKYKWSPVGEKLGPKFFLSTTLLVFLTDGYHLAQFMFFNLLALGFTLAIGWNLWLFIGLLVGVRIANWSARKIFEK